MNNLALEQCEKLEVIFPRVVLSYRIIAVAIVVVVVLVVLLVVLLVQSIVVVQLSIFIPAALLKTNRHAALPSPASKFSFHFLDQQSLPFCSACTTIFPEIPAAATISWLSSAFG